jgi:hypothetical protein
LDSENVEFPNQKISQLEGEQLVLIKPAKEQMAIVKSTLKSVNKTYDISKNELILEKTLQDIKNVVKEEKGGK